MQLKVRRFVWQVDMSNLQLLLTAKEMLVHGFESLGGMVTKNANIVLIVHERCEPILQCSGEKLASGNKLLLRLVD